MRRSFNRPTVFASIVGILFLLALGWKFYVSSSDKNYLKDKSTTLRTIGLQPGSVIKPTGKPIIPLSVQKSWFAVYGEKGCPKNHWRGGLLKIFKHWTKLAKEYNIDYVLMCGSLLGALRTGDVIPYDSDMDILVNFKHYELLKKLAVERDFDASDGEVRLVLQPEFERNISTVERKRYTCRGKLTPNMVDSCSFQDPMGRLVRRYLHIDLYPLYHKGNKLLDTAEGEVYIYKRKDMYPLRPCKMMGLDSYCPQKPWKILKTFYRTSKFEPTYKCKGNKWVDKNNKPL